jgi:hypothetical protein
MTSCRKTGRKMIDPNIVSPTRKLAADDTVKIESLNRRNGRMGSGARRSCHTNRLIDTIPASDRPMISGDDHSYSVPPHVVTRTMQVTAPISRPEPT